MVKTFFEMLASFWANWLETVLFIGGLTMIVIAAYFFNLIVGLFATGLAMVLVAKALVQERG
ncbi:hypothetical protein ACRYI5_03300 [Furfurilactobacillus sp. WILCCON 0119]|uniref:hypothetical protein n=1 Tax=Furfurilactobacillus entadae TaxID=2922307 RepID=UPI0035EC236D